MQNRRSEKLAVDVGFRRYRMVDSLTNTDIRKWYIRRYGQIIDLLFDAGTLGIRMVQRLLKNVNVKTVYAYWMEKNHDSVKLDCFLLFVVIF